MSQELNDFAHFRDNQLHHIDFTTGIIIAKAPNINRMFYDIGSENPDGYVRLWCKNNLRMKHRLVYFLYHGHLPDKCEELDHYNSVRNANHISNLRILVKSLNNTGCANRKFGKQFTKEDVHKACLMLQDTTESDDAIASAIGMSRGTIRDIKVRRSRQSIGQQYSWPHRGY